MPVVAGRSDTPPQEDDRRIDRQTDMQVDGQADRQADRDAPTGRTHGA